VGAEFWEHDLAQALRELEDELGSHGGGIGRPGHALHSANIAK
jgi:hypothetical protein